MQHGSERRYEHNGAAYIIRDVLTDEGTFMACEYAVKSESGHVRRLPCREGVFFEEIQPFEYAMPAKRTWVV